MLHTIYAAYIYNEKSHSFLSGFFWLVGMARVLVERLLGKLPASYFSVSCEYVSGECCAHIFN